jgi:hypothetical protein
VFESASISTTVHARGPASCKAVTSFPDAGGFARSQLNALVSVAHHRTGKPHGWIHNELRRICGGPPIAAATTAQLRARIDAVRELRA